MGNLLWTPAADEVVPGLYIGNLSGAQDGALLRKHRITHIVDVSNVAYPPPDLSLRYLRLPIPDVAEFDIRQIFGRTNAFIREATLAGGRVLVHCKMGVSRSASVVLAFLIAFGQLSLADAIDVLLAARPVIRPNRGFRAQLAVYEREVADFRANQSLRTRWWAQY